MSLGMIVKRLKGAEVLCLGYPDMAMPPEQVEAAMGFKPSTWLPSPHPDKIPYGYAETVATFKEAGATRVDCVDVKAHRKIERIVNLNDPQVWPRQYDLVINPGTLEHCFNLGVAWANAWAALKVLGVIVHIAPATMHNHGFWNINPLAVQDWCAANGGKVLQIMFAINGTAKVVEPHRLQSESGRGALPEETVMYALCRKQQAVELRWPLQGQYCV